MKKNRITVLYIVTTFFFSICTNAQDILWEKSFGGKHAEYLFDVVPTADFGFLLAGSSLSDKTGNKDQVRKGNLDYWLWKMDEKGDMDWQKSFGGSGSDFLQSIGGTADGGFILAGSSGSPKGYDKKEDSRGGNDFWIIKLDANGGEQWQKTIGGSGEDKLQIIRQTFDGGYIIGGTSNSGISAEKSDKGYGSLDYWIIRLNEKGVIVWQKTFGGKYADELRSLEQTHDGGFIAGGYSNSPISGNKSENSFGMGDYWILKLTNKGEIEWQKTVGGDKDEQLYVVHQTIDKGYILGGNSNSGSGKSKTKGSQNGTDFWVVKLDENGDTAWQQTYNFGKVDVLTSLIENDDRTFLIGGYAQSEVMGSAKDKKSINDYIALKISPSGEELWNTTAGSAGQDLLRKVIETRDGGYLLAGTSNGKPSRDKNSGMGGDDFWIVKLKDKDKPKKEPLRIEAIPNPAQQYTNVIVGYEYTKGTATVYDLNGRLIDNFLITDRTVPVSLETYPEGIYIVQIATDISTDSVKIIKGITK